MVFKSFASALSFLTIIPVPSAYNFDLATIAKSMYLFPLCGVIIGIIVGLVALLSSTVLPHYITSLLILVTLIIVTGVHHIDGLADFADGLMTGGDKESKRKAMSDPFVGASGTTALIINFIGLFVALINFESGLKLFYSIIVSEIIAKYVMVFQASVGHSAWSGFSSSFTIEMKKGHKIILSILITISIIYFIEGILGLLTLGIVIIIGLIILFVSYKKFGGVTGDVFGATNEISRLASLLILSTLMI
ncbi:MAG TPA: adenosylcobinamide-GDP ribazoletransferase [Nitrososphaeraceae archaeon]|nr:adenosylcobinamide-GDP ribazoletransferase [Nitrososphaeraceae archaeon]